MNQMWLEGDHLCAAFAQRGGQAKVLIISESKWHLSLDFKVFNAIKIVVIADALMKELSTLESPSWMGCLIDVPQGVTCMPHVPTVVLDRVQDAGNVGSILRCASAFGYRQVLALKGTAALWSPKVLRAGMGAHFGLNLVESITSAEVAALTVPMLVTSSHQGQWLDQGGLPWPCAWVLGHEGQGVSADLMAMAQQHIRIAQPGGEESLNVAAAAAICLYSSAPKSQGPR
jgi:TrmH family RNA methyltransferase